MWRDSKKMTFVPSIPLEEKLKPESNRSSDKSPGLAFLILLNLFEPFMSKYFYSGCPQRRKEARTIRQQAVRGRGQSGEQLLRLKPDGLHGLDGPAMGKIGKTSGPHGWYGSHNFFSWWWKSVVSRQHKVRLPVRHELLHYFEKVLSDKARKNDSVSYNTRLINVT